MRLGNDGIGPTQLCEVTHHMNYQEVNVGGMLLLPLSQASSNTALAR